MTVSTATPPAKLKPVRDDLKVGGKHKAVDNGDGTFDILDVCVFAEIPAGVKRNADPVGREWQEAALLQNKTREAGGHLPPVHVYHSDEVSVKPVYAGKLRLKSVRRTTYEGKDLWGTFADILGMPAEVFEKVRKGFLPYRSVEIHNWAKPEIDSLALMDTDVPFFRMPMLTVGEVLQKDAHMFLDKSRPSAVACRSGKKQGGLVLFRFAERGDMPDKDKEEEDEGALNAPPKSEETKQEADDEVDLTEPENPKDNATEGPGGAEMESEGEVPGAGAAEEKHPDAPQDAAMLEKAMAPIVSMLQNVGTLLKQLNDRLGPQPNPTEKHEAVGGMNLGLEAQNQDFKDKNTKEKEIVMAEKGVPQESGKITFNSKEELKAFMADTVKEVVLEATAPLKADVAAFRAATAENEKRAAVTARLDAAVKELTDNRQHVDEDLKKFLADAATVSDEFLKKQVAVFKARLPQDPPTDGADFETDLGKSAGNAADGDAVNQFCAEHGPQHAEWAKKELVKFRQASKAGFSDISEEEWLSVNFRAATMRERNKV